VNEQRFKRWFGSPTEEAQTERDNTLRRANEIRELVTRQAYKPELRDWLERMIKENRPQPGPNETVNYTIGLQAGLRLVEDRLVALEREARGIDD